MPVLKVSLVDELFRISFLPLSFSDKSVQILPNHFGNYIEIIIMIITKVASVDELFKISLLPLSFSDKSNPNLFKPPWKLYKI